MFHVIIQAEHKNLADGDRYRRMTTESDFTIPDENLIKELETEIALLRNHRDGRITSIVITHEKGF